MEIDLEARDQAERRENQVGRAAQLLTDPVARPLQRRPHRAPDVLERLPAGDAVVGEEHHPEAHPGMAGAGAAQGLVDGPENLRQRRRADQVGRQIGGLDIGQEGIGI